MYKIEDIRDIHLELTSKCQARCPMCPRRINGGIINPLIEINEVTLETFKLWFSIDVIKQLDSLFMCGNLGDPIIAQDCVSIFMYIRDINPSIQLSMHTNGSARTKDFWQALAYTNVKVTFGIDGLTDTHSLYRIGTDYSKILDNAREFINAGGNAEWHMLVFKHNEHQIEECRKVALEMNFKNFQIKHTSRFTSDHWPVLDDAGKTTHLLTPTDTSKTTILKIKESKLQSTVTSIQCKSQHNKQFYIASNGDVSPCCWLDVRWFLPSHPSRINFMDTISTFNNLNINSLIEIFNSGYFQQIENMWGVAPLSECSRQCGVFDKFGAQFVN